MTEARPKTFVVAAYNLLADAYIRPERYPRCDPRDFLPEARHPRLLARAAALDADMLCLSEVEASMFTRLEAHLTTLGYRGLWEQKWNGKPDGCAIFYRAPWSCADCFILPFDDGHTGKKPSGHVALAALLERDGEVVTLVSTHLKWDAPGTLPAHRQGLAQARELADQLVGLPRALVCVDFNAEPDDAVLEALRARAFVDAHPAACATFVSDGRAKKLDYLLHTPDLRARPLPDLVLADDAVLPSPTEPSDHAPLRAEFSLLP